MSNKYNCEMDESVDEINRKICLKIKIERVKRALTQKQLAEVSGVSQTSIWAIETNKKNPSSLTLAKFAKAFSITVSELTDISEINC